MACCHGYHVSLGIGTITPLLAVAVIPITGILGVIVGASVDVGYAVHVGVDVGTIGAKTVLVGVAVGVAVRVGVAGIREVALGVGVNTCVMVSIGDAVAVGDNTTLGATVAVGVGVIGLSDDISEAGGCSGIVVMKGIISSSIF